MTRKRFFALLASVPLCRAIAARLRASEPVVRAVIPPKEQPCVPVDFDVLLWAIAEVETGNNDRKVGKCGSRSKFQISEKVWRQWAGNRSFSFCRGAEAKDCALEHLAWLDRHIPRVTLVERYEREFALGWAWNSGLESYLNRGHDKRYLKVANYAQRVQDTYQSRLTPTPKA